MLVTPWRNDNGGSLTIQTFERVKKNLARFREIFWDASDAFIGHAEVWILRGFRGFDSSKMIPY